MNMTMIKVVSSMFKKTNFFSLMFVVTELNQFKIVHFLPIFGLWNRDHVTGRPKTWCAYSLYLHPLCVQISAFHVQQIYSYKQINKLSKQKRQFFFQCRVPKSRSRNLGSSKLAYMMFLLQSYYYPKFNFVCLIVF